MYDCHPSRTGLGGTGIHPVTSESNLGDLNIGYIKKVISYHYHGGEQKSPAMASAGVGKAEYNDKDYTNVDSLGA